MLLVARMDVGLRCTMWMSASRFHLVISVLLSLSVCWRGVAQGSDAGKLFLDQREWEVKWIAGNASANDGKCGEFSVLIGLIFKMLSSTSLTCC